jgi:hypothetical protein
VAVYAVCRLWEKDDRSWWYALAGLAAGFTATNELPALALTAGLGLVLLWRSPARTLLWYVPAAVLPLLALAATNYAALGEIRPAYDKFGGPWYKYEGSHWARTEKRGIDFAREHETQGAYAFHLLVGHHGLFSLTPFVALSVAGVVMGLCRRPGESKFVLPASASPPGSAFSEERSRTVEAALVLPASPPLPWFLYPLTAGLSLVVVGFYLFKSDNYGGWTNGPRWLMWLTPLWLLTMLPAADWLARRRWGRTLAGVILVASVLSVSYMAWNPWRHPWIYTWMDSRGWIPY